MNYQPRTLEISRIISRPILAEITVVIPTLGRAILEESLAWIADGSAWPAELVVVDQGGNQDVNRWMADLSQLGIKTVYVPSKQRGRAAAVNRGIERVRTPFFAVTDDDCFVAQDWLESMSSHLQHRPLSVVTGMVEGFKEHGTFVVSSTDMRIFHRPHLKFDKLSGGNMGTSLAVMEKVGPFDEDPRLRMAEDGEFAYRVLRAGIPIVYAPDVCVQHFSWRDDNQRIEQYGEYARSHGGFYGKYLRKGDWFIGIRAILHHLRALRRWVRGTLVKDKEMAAVGRAYFFGLMPGIIRGIGQGETE